MGVAMTTHAELRYTSADLETMPDDGKRYEIIDGELHVSKQPNWYHQRASTRIARFLDIWSDETGLGEVNTAPGLIFADDEDIAPDVVWISAERLTNALEPDGKLHSAPELAIEILSPGTANERRDREAKLKLYSRRGVQEYWIADWQRRQVEVYRRENAVLRLVQTLLPGDEITSPLLPGFRCLIDRFFSLR
jgi:Uma2 family endonuclease